MAPVAVLRIGQDSVADGLDAAHERRDIALRQRFRLGYGRDHSVGEIVDQADQEVPGPHGRIANLQLKNLLGRVERCEPRNRPLALKSVRRHSPGFRLESVRARLHERPDRFLDDQPDQVVRRVVAARTLAREDVGADGHPVAVGREFVFQQPLVDRAELADAEVAVIDVAALARLVPLEGEGVDDIRHHPVAETDAIEKRHARPVEQPAVVGRKADRGVAQIHSTAEIVDR